MGVSIDMPKSYNPLIGHDSPDDPYGEGSGGSRRVTTRKRHLPDVYDSSGAGVFNTWITDTSGHPVSGKTTTVVKAYPAFTGTIRGSQITTSENHPDWATTYGRDKNYRKPLASDLKRFPSGEGLLLDYFSESPSFDSGGEFYTQRINVDALNAHDVHVEARRNVSQFNDRAASYDGPAYAVSDVRVAPSMSQSDLTSMGTTAIARCAPTNNVASAANDLIEFWRDGVPKLFGATLWRERVLAAKKGKKDLYGLSRSASDEYLNKVFGWDPLVRDIKALAGQVVHAHKVLSQYERDSGRVVRRRYHFHPEYTDSTVVLRGDKAFIGDGNLPLNTDWLFVGTAPLYKRTQTHRQVWFSGAFTYHLPVGYKAREGMIRNASQAEELLGLRITPEVLWNAAPWTWALDWFSNVGDVVANLSDWSTDGLVLKYGYIMEHTHVLDTYYFDGSGGLANPSVRPSPIAVSVETKRRQKATPYGFALHWEAFTAQQWAITAALGLTRDVLHVK